MTRRSKGLDPSGGSEVFPMVVPRPAAIAQVIDFPFAEIGMSIALSAFRPGTP